MTISLDHISFFVSIMLNVLHWDFYIIWCVQLNSWWLLRCYLLDPDFLFHLFVPKLKTFRLRRCAVVDTMLPLPSVWRSLSLLSDHRILGVELQGFGTLRWSFYKNIHMPWYQYNNIRVHNLYIFERNIESTVWQDVGYMVVVRLSICLYSMLLNSFCSYDLTRNV